MTKLFTPLTIRSITLKNRVVMSPMCMYSCEDGFATDWHLVHYGSRAIGGVGMVTVEATAVRADGRISVGDMGIWKDEHIDGLHRIASFVKQAGAVPAIQLAHSGRKGSYWVAGADSKLLTEEEGGWEVIAPSAVPFSDKSPMPREMTEEDIREIKQCFVDGAKRALTAGFEVVEIHSAHGYLLHSFLSPLSNQRTDGYGGSRENRAKLLLEIVDEVRAIWPSDYPLSVRISATEWADGGWDIEDSIWLAHQFADRGVDILDVSSGGNVPGVKIPIYPGYQVPLADAIRQNVRGRLHVGGVGLITDAKQADEILEKGQADLVYFGRELLRDPYFVLPAAKRLDEEGVFPKQYERGL